MGLSGGFQPNLQDAAPPDSPAKDINFVKEAFHNQYNLIALGGLAASALLFWTGLPLIVAGGLELMYLAVVPQNWRFQRLVRSWKFGEEQRAREQKLADMLRSLPPDMQTRYVNLAQVCGSIRNNYSQLTSTSQIFVQQMDQRLQGLLNGYARLLNAAWQQRQYLKTADADTIKKEIATLQQRMNQDPPKVQDINKKRIEILGKRVEKYTKIVENRQVVDAQCSAVEDVLQLVRDQSVTMRDPQQVSDQLENLVHDVEQTEQTVQQVEAIFSNLTPDMEGIMQDTSSSSSSTSSAQRTRIGS
jgi:chromosome segregation ATPase